MGQLEYRRCLFDSVELWIVIFYCRIQMHTWSGKLIKYAAPLTKTYSPNSIDRWATRVKLKTTHVSHSSDKIDCQLRIFIPGGLIYNTTKRGCPRFPTQIRMKPLTVASSCASQFCGVWLSGFRNLNHNRAQLLDSKRRELRRGFIVFGG